MNVELAKRAVACKGWRYLDGCKCLDDGKQHAMGPVFWRLANGVWEPLGHSLRARSLDSFQGLPDFDDPATFGCLLAIVREAYGDPYLSGDWDGFRWCTIRGDGRLVRARNRMESLYCLGNTESKALIAALEAAPEKPCKPT